MADVTDPAVAAELKKKRTFRTFSYRGVELDKLLDMSNEDFVELVHARARRRFQRGLKRRPMGLIKKLRKAKKEAPPNEKPAVVKTHLRDMIIVPEMIGSVVGIYNGKVFNSVEIKPEMTGHYLGEFSCSYRPVKHGRPGIGATHCKPHSLLPSALITHCDTFAAPASNSLPIVFNSVEIKPEMTGNYLGELSCSYRPVKHGRPSISAAHCSRKAKGGLTTTTTATRLHSITTSTIMSTQSMRSQKYYLPDTGMAIFKHDTLRKWTRPAFNDLVVRKNPLTAKEMKNLGPIRSAVICAEREKYAAQPKNTGFGYDLAYVTEVDYDDVSEGNPVTIQATIPWFNDDSIC
ncbi:unnamed protein product [Cyclocybe aegerita]|uniref:40S ribosomal protein S15 n=1 Tax=Cyclocybe aegerita TaxID=1973307 RepID=A0A8S0WWF3_CYCAE|nr:unnamed protein product [Cyclocybe aegerita]